MGFTKWLFKHGFGSIGSTARAWTKIYLDTISGSDNEIYKEAAFMHVISVYCVANMRVRQQSYSTESTLLLRKSEGCLAMLMWILIYEIPSNVKAVLTDEKTFEIACEVIYQCVMEIAPHCILMTPVQFKSKCLEYLNYRDNFIRVLSTNNNKYEPKYKTAIIHRIDKWHYTEFENVLFKNAEEKYFYLAENNNDEEYIIWTIEMNSNKYVYAHFCNDDSFKMKFNNEIKNTNGKIKLSYIDD